MAYRDVFFSIVSLLALALASSAKEKSPVSYKGAQVWRTPLQSDTDVQTFQKFRAEGNISLWSLSGNRADYLVLQENQDIVHRELLERNLNHTTLIKNVQERIEDSKVQDSPWTDISLKVGHRLNFKSYPSIDVIDEYLNILKDNYASILHVETIEKSVENRSIKLIRISNGDPSNKAIVITAGLHGRDWIAITSALYIIKNIAEKYDKQPVYMTNKDWYIVPVMNPDGYAYTQTTDRLWQKNRRKNDKNDCPGVDLNRNFPTHWQRNDQCEDTYSGPNAFSEPETLALLNVINSFESKVPDIYIDLHSYGQIILFPWSVSNNDSESESDTNLKSTAAIIKSAIYNATRSKYKYGIPAQTKYPMTGTAIDWVHSKGVILTYSLEIRDTGAHGFLIPYTEIEFTGKEMLGAVRALAKSLEPPVMRDGYYHRWF